MYRVVVADDQVNQIAVPADVLGRTTLARTDYSDAFRISDPVRSRTAEEFLREMLETAYPSLRRSLVLGWNALGMRVALRTSPDRVLGWGIERSEPDLVVVAADSRIRMLDGRLVVLRDEQGYVFSTQGRLRNRLIRMVWSRIVPSHERVVTGLLTAQVRRAPFPSA